MAYLIDSDVLIEAKDRHYGFDFCPGFWAWLVREREVGNVFSVEKIHEELTASHDELSTWAEAQGPGFFLVPDGATTSSLATVAALVAGMRVNNQPYLPAALATFLASGDYYLIAHAHAHGHVVVSHETGHANGQQASLKRLKIPDVCQAVGVVCVDPFRMLRQGGAVLTL
jgi:hypothetical protein